MPPHRFAPSVSVVMPCFNAEQHLPMSVGSVLAQSFSDWELIAVDDGSRDGTLAWLRELADPRIRVHSQPNKGVSAARNAGLALARGDFIAFLDADDTWATGFLAEMTAALNTSPKAVLAYCGWQNCGLPGRRGNPFVPPDYEGPGKTICLLEGCRWPIHACLTYRKLVARAGGFDTRLRIGEDYLLWLEISSLGKIVRVPAVLAHYHHHDGIQATKNRTQAVIDIFEAKKIFLRRHPEVASTLKVDEIEGLTWGTLVRDANALYWGGNLDGARPIFRKVLFSGRGTLNDKLRMLPSILPRWIHEAIFRAKESLTGK